MKILVTGCSGFIGRPITRQLLDLGHEVLGVSRQETDFSHPGFTACLSDFTCWGLLDGAVRAFRPDAVIHAAWHRTHDYSETACRINLMAGLNLLTFVFSLPSVKTVVGLGSCLEHQTEPTWFTWCKRSLAEAGALHARSTGKAFRWARVFYAYGPGQRDAALIPSLLKAAREGRPLTCAQPENTCDFVHVDDVADALVRAALREEADVLTFDCGSGIARRLQDVVTCVDAAWQGKLVEPPGTEGLAARMDIPAEALGWSPRVALSAGISQLISRP